jgi:superfamily II DNA or RNA helicase
MAQRKPWSFPVDDDLLEDDDVPIEVETDADGGVVVLQGGRSLAAFPGHGGLPARGQPLALSWKQHLASVEAAMQRGLTAAVWQWPAGRELLYVIDVRRTMEGRGLVLETLHRDRRAGGGWSKPRALKISQQQVAALPDPEDCRALSLLAAATAPDTSWPAYWRSYGTVGTVPSSYLLAPSLSEQLVPLICRTGRCFLRREPGVEELSPLAWDDGEPWMFHVVVHEDAATRRYVVAGSLRRGEERMDLSAPILLLAGGLVFTAERAARLDDAGAFPWISELRQHGPFPVPRGQGTKLVASILALPRVPRLELPDGLRYDEVRVTPRPRLRVRPAPPGWSQDRLLGGLSFDYDGVVAAADEPGHGIFDSERRRFTVRDREAEQAASARLAQLHFKRGTYYEARGTRTGLQLAARRLPRVVSTLLREGWQVEADGKLYRHAGSFRIEVTSGIDWFELHGAVNFGDAVATLPELLVALKRGEQAVLLGDGTYGVLPEEWLRKCGLLAGLGRAKDGHLRFSRGQVGVLDALLAATPDATWDATFARARDELRRFDGIEPRDASAEFVGQLRPYQRDGLGWLDFLGRFGFGGCLADDMGLGKTVQVLALLEARREARERSSSLAGRAEAAGEVDGVGIAPGRPRASLVVVPRSLVFNWKAEAERFAPKLRVLDHTGIDRLRGTDHLDGYDVVLTTYGTLRRDIVDLKDARFDYVVLDEAQAVKNADTESAKAARLLRADHRLVLSGTPVQNHLGELWSLFEFLNPGMLGTASAFDLNGSGARTPDVETRGLLARALRPFILRRTKEQVARELPDKLEQTLYCELEGEQRTRYDEIRDHYRRALLGRIDRDGIGRSAIHVLEALLRLRQAACHPALIDRSRAGESSAKLDVLLPRLAEVVEEGHKALVFSQFTSFLGLVRARLDRDGLRYEYLDGRTRDRWARVAAFQDDPDCQVFLVSLKAGGLGLNLTAAEYVFLLDPWWNPAVEAQAIDRTHRIGQTRPVFAYRLIARDTVEEKVLELQQSKRDLAASIITADNSLIRALTREDLKLLLS